MYKLEEKFIKDLFTDYSRAMVRRVSTQIELLQQDKSLTKEQTLDLLKGFGKELVYNSFKDLEAQIKAYQAGRRTTKFDIYTPSPIQE